MPDKGHKYRYKNYDLVKAFSIGAYRGYSNRMKIRGDTLYSFSCPIAIRLWDKFIISNRAGFLGGEAYSVTTSRHIDYAYWICQKAKPVELVDGWADVGKKRWYIPQRPHYKYRGWLIRSFANNWFYSFTPTIYVGEWLPEIGSRHIKSWHDKYSLYLDGELVAVRRHTDDFHPEEAKGRLYGSEVVNCMSKENCKECPRRWLCLTSAEKFWGYRFWVISGTKWEKRLLESLPFSMTLTLTAGKEYLARKYSEYLPMVVT